VPAQQAVRIAQLTARQSFDVVVETVGRSHFVSFPITFAIPCSGMRAQSGRCPLS
jgi:hypothetical protein